MISIYVIQVVSKFMHNSSFYGGITLFDVYLMIVEICDTFYGIKLSSKNIVSNILICYMKSPPPCGDITPMEVVSNSRAEPQS